MCALLCGLVAAAVYRPAIDGEFAWDDRLLILDNDRVLGDWSRTLQAFSAPAIGGYYRPVLIVSFALDRHLFGLDPAAYHRTNVLLHAANSALVCLALFVLLDHLTAAVVGALVFALHPLQTQAVALITGRNDLLLLAPFVVALLAWRRAARSRGPGRPVLLASVVALYVLVLLTKEVGIVLPAVLLASDALVGDPSPATRRWRTGFMAGLVIVAVAWLAFRAQALGAVLSGEVYRSGDLPTRLMQVVATFGYYLRCVILPWGYACTPYHDGLIRPLGLPFVAAAAAGLTFVAALGWSWRRHRRVAFGLVFFVLTVLPVLGWVPMGLLMLEHRLYVPMVGVGILAGAGLVEAGRGRRRRVGAAAAVLAVAAVTALGVAASYRIPVHRSDLSLWQATVRRVPVSAYARHELGYALASAGRDREAIVQLEEALRLEPTHARARHKLALALDRTGRRHEAIVELETLVSDHPGYVEGYNALGVLQARKGDLEAVRASLARGLERDPDNVRILGNLAQILARIDRQDESVEIYRRLTALTPDDPTPWHRLGRVLLEAGRPAEAVAPLQRALTLRPRDGSLHVDLCRARFRSGDLDLALDHARRARDLGEEDPFVEHVLRVYGGPRP